MITSGLKWPRCHPGGYDQVLYRVYGSTMCTALLLMFCLPSCWMSVHMAPGRIQPRLNQLLLRLLMWRSPWKSLVIHGYSYIIKTKEHSRQLREKVTEKWKSRDGEKKTFQSHGGPPGVQLYLSLWNEWNVNLPRRRQAGDTKTPLKELKPSAAEIGEILQ